MSENEHPIVKDLEARATQLEHLAERQEEVARVEEAMAHEEREEARKIREEAHRLAEAEGEITIFVNGTSYSTEKRSLSYEHLLELINAPPLPDGKRYQVLYTNGPRHKPTGTLIEGQSVELKNHMEFDVTPANRS